MYKEVFEAVESIIGEVYMVGGCVRDILMGTKPSDYDFCTPIHPDEIEDKVRAAGRRPYISGKKFGTVGFKYAGKLVEVTTFRRERYERNNRKPHVEFVDDLQLDLSRRDFTVNAIALKLGRGSAEYVDPFGGIGDIKTGIICTVGDADDRIIEDPLRMLRAARFASELDFETDRKLVAKIRKNANLIYGVSKERLTAEIDKLLVGKNPENGLNVLEDTELLRYVLPELWLQIGFDQDSPYHRLSLWEHTKKVVSLSPRDVETRWAALLHDVGKPYAKKKNAKGNSSYYLHSVIGAELTRGIAFRMKWSKARTENICQLILGHMSDGNPLRYADNKSKT